MYGATGPPGPVSRNFALGLDGGGWRGLLDACFKK